MAKSLKLTKTEIRELINVKKNNMKYPEHLQFTHTPTPLKKISDDWFDYQVFVKRDDLTGIELSGNKVRKLDFLLQEAISKGAQHVITCGGVQSNHCRATAFLAAQLGLKATLVLKGEPPRAKATGNFLLDKIVGAQFLFVTEDEYQEVEEIMKTVQNQSSEPAYIIPEGGSNAVGAWGYVKAFEEIIHQWPAVEVIVVPTGSGGTHAGLLLGKWLTGHPCTIWSVNVCDSAAFFKKKILNIVRQFKQRFVPDLPINEQDIHIVDGFVGQGYGKVGNLEIEKIKQVARRFGFLLDPVYTVKAWLGFEDLLRNQQLPGKNVVFVHTGGVFGLFAYADLF